VCTIGLYERRNHHHAQAHQYCPPEETLELTDRVTEHGDRSHFIDEAVRHYIEETGRANLRKRLKEGAIQRAERDLPLAEERFTVDEEVWHGGRR
jgi:CopG family transcriptional regulator / antitoxin EndoAI